MDILFFGWMRQYAPRRFIDQLNIAVKNKIWNLSKNNLTERPLLYLQYAPRIKDYIIMSFFIDL